MVFPCMDFFSAIFHVSMFSRACGNPDMRTHHFLTWSQNSEFPEADMKWRRSETPILLFYYYSIDSTSKRSSIDLVVKAFDVREQFTHITEIAHSLHARLKSVN